MADYLVNIHQFRRESFANTLKDAVSAVFGWDRELLEGRTRLVGIRDASIAAQRQVLGTIGVGRDLVPAAARTEDVGHREDVARVWVEHDGATTAGVHLAHGLVEPTLDHVLHHQIDRED